MPTSRAYVTGESGPAHGYEHFRREQAHVADFVDLLATAHDQQYFAISFADVRLDLPWTNDRRQCAGVRIGGFPGCFPALLVSDRDREREHRANWPGLRRARRAQGEKGCGHGAWCDDGLRDYRRDRRYAGLAVDVAGTGHTGGDSTRRRRLYPRHLSHRADHLSLPRLHHVSSRRRRFADAALLPHREFCSGGLLHAGFHSRLVRSAAPRRRKRRLFRARLPTALV